MTHGKLFEPILDLVLETMPRDNLLNSACLELFEHIKKENIKNIISHLVENYREKLTKITHVDTFSNYIMRYDQTQGFAPNAETSYVDTEEDTPPKRPQTGRGGRWDAGLKDLDDQEEEYYNTSDNEEDVAVKASSPSRTSANGASPASKLLVDYNSDEENEMETDISAGILGADENPSPPSQSQDDSTGVTSPIALPIQSPLEKLSEKRRREEEDDDELSKLSQPKRRNSTSSVASNASSVLKKKKSFNSSPNGNTGSKNKIAISISPAIKTGGQSPGGADGGN